MVAGREGGRNRGRVRGRKEVREEKWGENRRGGGKKRQITVVEGR